MSRPPVRSPTQHSFSRQGFQPLGTSRSRSNTMQGDATIDIPLERVQTYNSGYRQNGITSPGGLGQQGSFARETSPTEKGGLFRRGGGRRKVRKLNSKGEPEGAFQQAEEEGTLNKMGRIYNKILNFSIVTRYFIYVAPLALCIAVPIIVGATAAQDASIGGVRMVWFFTWIEVVWLSLWVSKIVAHYLPKFFQFIMGVVSSGVRKYALVIKALEIPLSLVGWAVTSLATFTPLMLRNPEARHAKLGMQHWMSIVQRILAAALVAALIYLAERVLIQLISINYHRKQFEGKIKDSKRNIYLLGQLFDASRALFPMYCNEFMEEDYIINDGLNLPVSGKGSHKRSGSATPLRLIHDVGRFGDKLASAFGDVAHEITGKNVFNVNSAHSIVVEALEKPRSSEALAKRIWMSFVVEGKEALYRDDIVEVLGADREDEADECFYSLDKDNNGDVSLDEMIFTVTEYGRERKAIANSMHDVDQAIHVLDSLLCTVVFIVVIFVFVAFLNANFTTTLATAGTALLSLSFVFAATTQEVLGSCIFLFVKHPYDIGDRVDVTGTQLTVDHIALLYTSFKNVQSGKFVQIPNIVLNGLWVENITRSLAMREQISVFCSFDTPFEDIQALKNEMLNFVRHKDNNRDFQPDLDIEVLGIAEMNKMELRIEIRHKSNWANETVRAARRSKFMCALVVALRKVPIYAPGASAPGAGDPANPTYSVGISDEQAAANKAEFDEKKEEKRLINQKDEGPSDTKSPTTGKSTGVDYLGKQSATSPTVGLSRDPSQEAKAIDALSARHPAMDFARDAGVDDASTLGERPSVDHQDLEDVRGLLRRESTRGKRRVQDSQSAFSPRIPTIQEPISQRDYSHLRPGGLSSGSPPRVPVASPAGVVPQIREPAPGNAFAQQQQQQQQYRP